MVAGGIVLPPVDQSNQPLAGGIINRPPYQKMFRTIDFRCFSENASATLRHQQVTGIPKSRVCRDARQGVRSSTLQGDHQLGCRAGLAGRPVHFGQHLADHRDARLNSLGQPHGVLNVHGFKQWALLQPISLQQPVDLVHFTTKPDHQHPPMVRVAGIAPHHPLQGFKTLALTRHSASGSMDKRHNPVNIRVPRHFLGPEGRRDHSRRRS